VNKFVFRRLLLISVLGILISILVYTADLALEPKYLIIGAVVGGYITAIPIILSGWSMLFNAQKVVFNMLSALSHRSSRGIALLGPINNRGSTEFVVLGKDYVENNVLSSFVRDSPKDNDFSHQSQEQNKIFYDSFASKQVKNSGPVILLHKSGAVTPVSRGLSTFSRDVTMLRYLNTVQLFDLIRQMVFMSGGPELELALSELKVRLNHENVNKKIFIYH